MRKTGISIPDVAIVRKSNLSDKAEIIEQMQGAGAPPPDPTLEAKVKLIEAQTRKTDAETTTKNVEAMFSATSAANQIALMPSIAQPADQMLMSAGFKDANAAPGIPGMPPDAQGVPGIPENTSPNFPPRIPQPDSGINAGIEAGPQ